MNYLIRCKPLLGTYVEVKISGNRSRQCLSLEVDRIFERMKYIHHLMSFHEEDSELTYINRNAYIQKCRLSNEMQRVLSQAMELSQLTHGDFDISVADGLMAAHQLPHKFVFFKEKGHWKDILLREGEVKFTKEWAIDLGGIAKGYAVDEGMRVIQDPSLEVCINAGGDLSMTYWKDARVNVQVSSKWRKKLHLVQMKNKSLATSASYYLHPKQGSIINPRSRKPLKDRRVVSVFAENCMLADALTKVIFLSDHAETVMQYYGAESIVFDSRGRLL